MAVLRMIVVDAVAAEGPIHLRAEQLANFWRKGSCPAFVVAAETAEVVAVDRSLQIHRLSLSPSWIDGTDLSIEAAAALAIAFALVLE